MKPMTDVEVLPVLSSFGGVLFFLSLMGYAFWLMLILPKLKAGGALLAALCNMLFVAYWGVIILEWMVPIAYILMFGGLPGCLFGVFALCTNRFRFRTRVLTLPMLFYLLMGCCFAILLRNQSIDGHDAYSFWARAAKELFTFDISYFNANSNISHSDYNPIFAALQYAVVRVFGWQDASLFYIPAACFITSVCAVCDFLRRKTAALLFVCFALLLYPVFRFSYYTLTVDGPLSMLFFAGLFCLLPWEKEEGSGLFPALCVSAVLPAIKLYSGLLFALVLLAVLFLRARKKTMPSADNAPSLRYGVIACVLVLLMQFSWSGYYHYQNRISAYEASVASIAYQQAEIPANLQPPTFRLNNLFSGNPRTQRLLSSVSEENLNAVFMLIRETGNMYLHSTLPAALVFALLLLLTACLAKGQERRQCTLALIALAAAALLYTGGLFAGYFVQAEIAGGALNYLPTVSLPFVLTTIFFALRSAFCPQSRFRHIVRILLPLCAVWGIFILIPSTQPTSPGAEEALPLGTQAYTQEFFADELQELLTQQDENARAVLMDCTWDASEIKSKSGITHAYQYYALPIRLDVYQFEYGNYDALDGITFEFLSNAAIAHRADMLILRLDDDLYLDAFQTALDLETDSYPPWVFDITVSNGEVSFLLRDDMQEE